MRKTLLAALGVALAGGMMTALLMSTPAQAQAPIVMKMSTATINDTQHEWLKRFAALVEKDSGGSIKGEIYPASQLGSIPRQIEGVQFGSIQGWMGPPEFLVGVDVRFEAMSAPGLFSSTDQVVKVAQRSADPEDDVRDGRAEGPRRASGFAPIGPSSILSKKQVSKLADLNGMKIRVLASPFQLELIRRMDASPIAMTLADVLPGLQQGTIDGTLDDDDRLHDDEVSTTSASTCIQNDQPYVNSIGVMSKRWMDGLPADLQKIVRDSGAKVSAEIMPFVKDFFNEQDEDLEDRNGGMIANLPQAEFDAMMAKISTIGDDLSKDEARNSTRR